MSEPGTRATPREGREGRYHGGSPMTAARPMDHEMLRRPIAVLGAALLGLVLAGCQSGPQSVPDGTYRLLSDASTTSPGAGDSLQISSNAVMLSSAGATTSAELGAATAQYTFCPPSGKGTARSLGSPLTINGTDYATPAVFGDCGQAKPTRVTIVDLDSYNDGATQLPFSRWAEFCDVSDPDCS